MVQQHWILVLLLEDDGVLNNFGYGIVRCSEGRKDSLGGLGDFGITGIDLLRTYGTMKPRHF
jgi:hypothetical protein